MDKSLAEYLFDIAIWIDDCPNEYRKIPEYLRDAFSRAVTEAHKCIPPDIPSGVGGADAN